MLTKEEENIQEIEVNKEPVAATAIDMKMEARKADNEALDDYTIAKKLVQLKQSADSRKISFSLHFSTVKKLLSSKTCYYTGKTFTKKGENSRTIDRVDPNKGYTDDNVVACTSSINLKKGNLTVEEILMIASKIENPRKKNYKK